MSMSMFSVQNKQDVQTSFSDIEEILFIYYYVKVIKIQSYIQKKTK